MENNNFVPFIFTNLKFVNELFAFAQSEGCTEIFERAIDEQSCKTEKELAGFLLYEIDQTAKGNDENHNFIFWDDLDLFSMARWVKEAEVKYGIK